MTTIDGPMASEYTNVDILKMYPYLESEDLVATLSYCALRSGEMDVPLKVA